MAIESKLKRVDREDHPDRCQGIYKYGQCPYERTPHGPFCVMHGGHHAENAHEKKMVKQYQLAQWQQRVSEFANDDDEIKSLRGEIGILRMTLEQVVVQCKTPMDIVLWSGKIGDLVGKLEKLIVSCNRLEASSGMLLDKSAALNLATQIVNIITTYVDDAEVIDRVSTDIIQAIVGLNKTESV